MDFADLETNLTLWVGSLATDRRGPVGTVIPVEWGRRPHKAHQGPYILAYLGAIVPIGQDWPEYEYDELTDELVEVMHGIRRITLRLSFRNFDQRLGYSARQYAEDFRGRCSSTYSRNTRHDGLFSLWRTGGLIDVDYMQSGRWVSQVEMDVTIGINFFIEDMDFTGEYIKTVEIEHQSGVTDEYGNQVYTEIGEPVIEEAFSTIIVTADEEP